MAGLCADWVGTKLAGMVGVRVIECTLVRVSLEALLTMPTESEGRLWARVGMAFGSLYLVESTNVVGLRAILEVASPGELARIAVVDTWLDVLDRRKPQGGTWNLLIDTADQRGKLRVIDFGLELTEILGPPVLGGVPNAVRCPEEWLPYVHPADVEQAIRDVNRIDSAEIL